MTDYFVSNAGSDAANGLTSGTAWQTVAKVNGFTFASGDHIYFRRGDRWYETLTVPRNTLNFGAYGAAATFDADQYDIRGAAKGYGTNAPVIDGGVFVTGWSAYTTPIITTQDEMTGTSGTDLTAHTPNTAGTPATRHPNLASKSSILTPTNTARRANATNLVHYLFGSPQSVPDYFVECDAICKTVLANDSLWLTARNQASGVAERCYAASISGTAVAVRRLSDSPAGSTPVTAAFTPVAGTTYRLRFEVVGPTITVYVNGVQKATWTDTDGTAGAAVYPTGGVAGFRLGASAAANQGDTTGWQIDNVVVSAFASLPSGVFLASCAARPRIVDAFQTYYKEGNSLGSLVAGQWFWDSPSTTLYICTPTVGSVSNTDVVKDSRLNCVVGAGRTDITFEDMAFEHAGAATVSFTSGGARATLRRCYVQRSTRNYRGSGEVLSGNIGALSFIGANDPTVEYCVVRNVGGEAIWPDCTGGQFRYSYLGPCFEWSSDCIHSEHTALVTDVIAHTVVGNHMTMLGSASIKGCVIMFGASHIVTDNYFENANWGFIVAGNDAVISRNVGYNLASFIKIDDHAPGWPIDNIQIDHNIGIDCGFGILSTSSGGTAARTNLVVVANTLVNTARVPTFLFRADDDISGVFKDNILWNASGSGGTYKVTSVAGGGWDSDYNLLGNEATGFINVLGVSYNTLAAYVAAASKDAHSVRSAPLFQGVGDPTGNESAVGYGEYYRNSGASPQYHTGVIVAGLTGASGLQDMGALPNLGYWGAGLPLLLAAGGPPAAGGFIDLPTPLVIATGETFLVIGGGEAPLVLQGTETEMVIDGDK